MSRRSRTASRVGRAVALLLLLVLLPGCRGRGATARPLPGTEKNDERPVIPGERVELVSAPGHPSLQLVRRQGDPTGALAVAVFPPGGSAGSLQMAALVKMRLERADVEHQLQAHGIGFVLARRITRPEDAPDWLSAVHAALNSKIGEEDLNALEDVPLLQAARDRSDLLSPFGLCMGVLGAEGREALDEALRNVNDPGYEKFLEQLRADTAVAPRIGLAALGEQALLDAVQKSHSHKWAGGEALDDSWSERELTAVAAARGAREVRLALRLTDTEAALATARALQDEGHPLHGRLHALDPFLRATDVQVTLRPAGACVGLAVNFGREKQPSLDLVASVALLVKEELNATARQSLSDDEQTLAILAPYDSLESAALAAWTAVRSSRTGGMSQEILEYRASEPATVTHQALSQALAETKAAWAERRIPIAQRNESGQPELWMLIASPCGTSPESAEEAGLRALTVASLARDFDRTQGVRLEPWVSSSAVGIIARSPARRSESVARHAERVARALGGALYGSPLDGRTFAASRAQQLDRIGSHPGVELATNILGAGLPSYANPWGLGKSVATFSVADAERTRADLAQEPLRLAIISNASVAQGAAAQAAIERWLAPARDHVTTCPAPELEEIPAGTWSVETIDEEVTPGAFVAVYAPVAPAVGHATAFLMNQRGGYLERAFSEPDLVANTRAEFWGNEAAGGLVVQVNAEPHLLERATHQTRAVLDALARGSMPEDDAQRALEEYRRREDATARRPRGRLIKLFRKGLTPGDFSPQPPTAAALREFHKRLGEAEHRVITVAQRK